MKVFTIFLLAMKQVKIILPEPVTTFITPGGIPALADSSANFKAVNGHTCAGFITTVFPAAKQAAIFQESIIRG